MEPMTLGSPMGSPAPTPGSPDTASAYLPSFLLGETNTPGRMGVSSVADTSRFSTLNSPSISSPLSSYQTPDYRHNRQKAMFANAASPGSPRMGGESHAGPPTRGLFDTFDTAQPAESVPTTRSLPRSQPRSLVNASDSFFLDSPNVGGGEAHGLLRWITVFGFPPSAVNTVLSHISNRVRIVDKHPAPQPQCNWIHLKCATEQEAQRALACNGNIVSGSVMIGVTPCTDEGVIMSPEKENRKVNGSMRIFASPTRISTPDSGGPHSPQSPKPRLMYNSQHFSPSAIRQTENVPQRSTGLVSKAMEMLGLGILDENE